MRNQLKYIAGLTAFGLLGMAQPVWAAGPPSPSPFSNPLAISLLALMLLLLMVIAILANILTGAADIRLKKKKAGNTAAVIITVPLLLLSQTLLAQGADPNAVPAPKVIGGLPATTFYVLIGIIFLELLIILGLLFNIRFLLKAEKEKLAPAEELAPEAVKAKKENQLSWWDKFNLFKPLSEEKDLDLGHEYDGIRELNNRLPPWWLYGFYITILFAGIYLWRYHVSHSAPSSKEEYERSVARAEARLQEYLKKKGDAVDENTVKVLTDAADLEAGKAIFLDPSKCVTCHGPEGGGNTIGPNLTDDYWIYGGSIQDIFKTIKYGAKNGMKSWKDDLTPRQMAQVSSYIKSLRGTKPANPKEPQGELYKEEAAPAAPAADSTAAKPGAVTMK